jgi:regulator of sigma E protease
MVLGKNEIEARLRGGGGAAGTGPALQGPVGIAVSTTDIVQDAGWRPVIEILALMSLNLGLFNVLPLPMLDGGKIAFILVEVLRGGKRITPRRESLVHLAGFIVMLAAALLVSYFDLARVIS